MCCLQCCEEHYLDRGVTDKKTGGLTTDKKTGYGRATDVSRLLQGVFFVRDLGQGGKNCQIVWVILKNTIMLQKVTVHLFVA